VKGRLERLVAGVRTHVGLRGGLRF
jgi:hypothetical protein